MPFLIFALLCALCLPLARAVPADKADTVSHDVPAWRTSMVHHAWSKQDGAPTGVYNFEQDAQGMLWFAATDGLYRFDGARFEHLTAIDGNPLRSLNTKAVRAFGDALWVGYNFGGISVFEHGRVSHYGEAQGLPPRSVYEIVRGANGKVWVSTSAGLYWRDGDHWRNVTPEQGLPAGEFQYFSALDDGSVLAFHPHGMYRSDTQGRRFERVKAPADLEIGHTLSDGTLLVVSREHRMYRYDPRSGRFTALVLPDGLQPFGVFVDGRGALWINTDAGAKLLDADLRTRRTFYAPQDLSGKVVYSMLTDREGNVWLSTENGIDRISESRLSTIALPPRMFSGLSVLADGAGTVWVGNYQTTGNYALASFGVLADGSRVATPLRNVTAATRAPDGSAWFGSARYLWHRAGTTWRSWTLPPELIGSDVQALAVDTGGRVWVSVLRKGVFVFEEGRWLPGGGHAALAARTAVSLYADAAGVVWIGYPGNRLARVAHGAVHEFGPDDGLGVGSITAMAGAGNSLWLGGDQGVNYFDGSRFHRVADASGADITAISGMVLTTAGELWLHGAAGLYRVDAAAVSAARQHQGTGLRLDIELFNYLDGHEGKPAQLRPLASLTQAADGKLWYATAATVGAIDPARIARNRLAPQPQVLALRTDDKTYRPLAGLVLPEHTSNIELDFTAAALTMPERVRFRFRLHGLERDWREAGARRVAYYTNLGPGDYRFEVMAFNEDGVPSAAPAALDFRISAAFYQTAWFKLLCGLLLLALLGLLYWWRLQLATARIAERLRERLHERQRIARTLHDNFLQSVQALVLQFSFIKDSLPEEHPAQRRIDAALDAADEVMVEGRDQVLDLRIEHGVAGQLEAALRDVGHRMAERHGAQFALQVQQPSRALKPSVSGEALAIAREAMANAYHHGRCARVDVTLHYDRRQFTLTVHDDGCGLSEEVLLRGHRPGHWGLTGMRERAEDIGAVLKVHSAPDQGTRITLCLAARHAYADQNRRRRQPDRMATV